MRQNENENQKRNTGTRISRDTGQTNNYCDISNNLEAYSRPHNETQFQVKIFLFLE